MLRCPGCGNTWTKKEYEDISFVDMSNGYCPSCDTDTGVKEV